MYFSVNSTCSTGSKYDVYELRSEVGQCKARVQRLKRELAKNTSTVHFINFCCFSGYVISLELI